MRKSRFIAEASLVAALYAVLVIALQPISFGVWQLRLADALMPLSMVMGWSAIVGLTLGCAIGNVFSPVPLTLVDIVGGSLANLAASYIAYLVGRGRGALWRVAGAVLEAVVVTLIVGTYLSILFEVPFTVSYMGVGLGSLASMVIIGVPLSLLVESALRRA